MSLPALLPPALAHWPAALLLGAARAAEPDAPRAAALRRIRAEALWWPAPRTGAARPKALALSTDALSAARARFDAADITLLTDPSLIEPDRLEAVFGDGPAALWAAMGGVEAERALPPEAALARAVGRCPWSGLPLALDEAVEAASLLHRAARLGRGPVRLVGMSRWKRRCVAPFLQGPDGKPRAARRGAEAGGGDAPCALWGAGDPAPGLLRVEDGFLRSVGLGLRHAKPLSLAIDEATPYFDATRRTGFENAVAKAEFTDALRARAARLRARIVALGLTKYNIGAAAALPDAAGRLKLLVPGQVAADASIRLGARAVRDDAALLRAARARFPDAFLLYKPHPDVETGLRAGRAPDAVIAETADALAPRGASATACLDWADRVATITSLMGFEALLRGRAVTTFGRPFYAGWGLTDDADPPGRDRALDLDALTAAALILYPRYVDPATGLPCPPEVALDALARARDAARTPRGRALSLWRAAISSVLARL